MEKLAGSLIQKVPLFFGFRPREMKVFLEICKLGSVDAGESLCEFNTSSNRLFILVDGKLDIVAPDKTVLATLQGVQTVGEMGFITRKPRTATVRAASDCKILRVDYIEFESLIERSLNLRSKIYRNMVRILADRLSDANDMVMRYRKLYESGRDPASFAREETKADLGDDAKAELVEVTPAEAEQPEVSGEEPDLEAEQPKVPSGEQEAEAGQRKEPVEEPEEERSEKSASDPGKAQVKKASEGGEEDFEGEAMPLLRQFYELAGIDERAEAVAEDLPLFRQLRQDGYSPVDIEYAIRWTVRNIPAVKRFSLVKLSIVEAFEDKWSV